MKEKYKEIEGDGNSQKINHIQLSKTFFPFINNNSDVKSENCKIKYNQLNTIDEYGLIYFFDEKGIFFIDNSKIKNIFVDEAEISRGNFFFLNSKQEIINVSKCESEDKLFLVLYVQNNKNESLLEYIYLENMLKQLKDVKEIYNKKEEPDSEKKIEENFSKDNKKLDIVHLFVGEEIEKWKEASAKYIKEKQQIIDKELNELSKDQKEKLNKDEINKITEEIKEKKKKN